MWMASLAVEPLAAWRWPLTAVYLLLLALICTYGLHRYWLVFLYGKHRRDVPRPKRRYETLPRVTVQLPMYNEGAVAERIIDAACALEYPADRLQIQVVDDSTDESAEIAQRCVERWKAHGVDIEYVHRTDRTGYKAGALANATATASGELIAIFDADFIPPPGFLKRTVHYFTDPGVGMVQTRWTHLNREDSLLTRGQAIFLDGHFVIEHTARNRSGVWMNFNGTAGIWRRKAIESAGGWEHDTLTEDVDLSYRAQLAGWRFVFLPRVACPAELPPEINAFKSQQHRWTKGSIQTAIKLLPRLLRSKASWRVKIEAIFHLTSPMVYLYVTLFALLFYPTIELNLRAFGTQTTSAAGHVVGGMGGDWWGMALGLVALMLGTVSAVVFYIASQRVQHRSGWWTLAQVPMLMSIGIGIALNNAVACLEALCGHESAFVRTPKYNVSSAPSAAGGRGRLRHAGLKAVIPIPSLKWSMTLIELAMGVYVLWCAKLSLAHNDTLIGLPFLLLFAAGYLYVGCTSFYIHLRGWLQMRRLRWRPG